jgi:hypothetical protein
MAKYFYPTLGGVHFIEKNSNTADALIDWSNRLHQDSMQRVIVTVLEGYRKPISITYEDGQRVMIENVSENTANLILHWSGSVVVEFICDGYLESLYYAKEEDARKFFNVR